jgi:poly-gamma-glutamate synthesis protein (capsule biosynthesis protein)
MSAKLLNPDLILVHYHFGEEYQRVPNSFQKEVVQKTIEMGADIIIGGHPHVLQPLQSIKSSKSAFDSVFVAYSLGNFISNQRKRYTDAGGILTLQICKNTNDHIIKITGAAFTPTWVFKGNTGSKNEYVILPSISSISDTNLFNLSESYSKKMIESIEDTKEVISKYSHGIIYH